MHQNKLIHVTLKFINSGRDEGNAELCALTQSIEMCTIRPMCKYFRKSQIKSEIAYFKVPFH